MQNIGVQYMGNNCFCKNNEKKEDSVEEKIKETRGCGCLNCKQLDSWYKPNCCLGRCKKVKD